MIVLVTGVAGFIGSYVAHYLLERGDKVVGIDNLNDYYEVKLKKDRLERLGVKSKLSSSTVYENFTFYHIDIANESSLEKIFIDYNFDVVCHLAAQAGVRYSLENPSTYIQSNIVGFANILELAKKSKIKHLVYASSSSVYGLNKKVPFSEKDNVDSPQVFMQLLKNQMS